MISLSLLLSRLESQAIDLDTIDLAQISGFFSIITRFRPAITNAALGTRDSSDLPSIPRDIVAIISLHTRLSHHFVRTLWICLGDVALNHEDLACMSTGAEDRTLIPHAATQQLGIATPFGFTPVESFSSISYRRRASNCLSSSRLPQASLRRLQAG